MSQAAGALCVPSLRCLVFLHGPAAPGPVPVCLGLSGGLLCPAHPQGKKRGELVRSLLVSYCGTLPPTQGLRAGTGVWETRKGIRGRPGPVRAGCHWRAHGTRSAEVTHGAVDSQGE